MNSPNDALQRTAPGSLSLGSFGAATRLPANKRDECFLLFRTLVAAGVLFVSACDDSMHASYSSAAAARAAGGVGRGWLPEELPDSAFSISESHNLDTNIGSGTFHFGPADEDSFRSKLQPASPADVQQLHQPDRLRRDGYSFYVVPEFALAVNWQTRHVHFVLALQREPGVVR